jgi:CDP-4-dehydro-6-deoxyglucose reductase
MIKNVTIKNGCIACGTCERICPKIFRVNGQSKVISKDFATNENLILEAEKNCPVNVIYVETDQAKSDEIFINAKFLKCRNISKGIWNVFLKIPNSDFKFIPGQYVSIKMTDANGDFLRSYSIVSFKNNILELCIKFNENSKGQAFFNKLSQDQSVSLTEGKGIFLLQKNKNQKIFIATGTGLAPIIAMLENADTENSNCEKTLIIGVREKEEIFYYERSKNISNLKLIYTLSRPSSDWNGEKGRVNEHFPKLNLTNETEIYICGNPDMVNDSVKYFEEKNHPKNKIFIENFTSSNVITKKLNTFSLKNLITNGYIPYLNVLKNSIYLIAILSIGYLILNPSNFRDMAAIGWNVMFAVMLIRPLSNIVPDFGILKTFVSTRRQFGILSAVLLLNHGIGFFLSQKISILSIFTNPMFLDYKQIFFWGILGLICASPALITSNNLSMKILKRNWKRIQKLAYLFFIFGAIHIYLIGEKDVLIYVAIISIFWLLAWKKIVFPKQKLYHALTSFFK